MSRMGGFAIELSGQTHGCYWVLVVCGWVVGGFGIMCATLDSIVLAGGAY